MAAPRLLVVGGLNMDLIVRVPRLPGPGETLIGGPFLQAAGGKGANQAVAAARLGARVAMLGRVGSDDFGSALLRGLRAEGISTERVMPTDDATGVALIYVDDAGENCIAVASGANDRLAPNDLEAAAFDGVEILLAQLESPLGAVETALRLARAAGARTILNAAPAQPLPSSLLALVDTLVVNEHEAAVLLGRERIAAGTEAQAASALRAHPAQTIVVTLGARGALAVASEQVIEQPSFQVAVVDTTAAGDAFVGALGVALGQGDPLSTALRFACAAGALACTRPGAQPSLPSKAEVQALLDLFQRT